MAVKQLKEMRTDWLLGFEMMIVLSCSYLFLVNF